MIRYPAGQITPHGVYHLLHGDIPHITYRSYDDTSVFHLAGPMAIHNPMLPETIRLKQLKGLVPPWKNIEQKGATQDGSTYVTSLYDPTEVDLVVEAVGRNPEMCRQVLRDWIAAWDAKQPGELSFFTPQLGRWWAEARWAKNPVGDINGGNWRHQNFTWVAKLYDSFWRSYDDVTQYRFAYTSSVDPFNFTTTSELGSGWDVAYSGPGTGAVHADGSQVVSTCINGRTAVCRRTGFTTTTDNQVVEIQVGKFPAWYMSTTAFVDVWARMGAGTADGVRLRIGHRTLRLSYFTGGTETVLRQQTMRVATRTTETYTLIAGFEGDPRLFKVLRGGAVIMTAKETGTGSPMGASYRGAGFGDAATGTVASPTIRAWGAGDNTTVAQTGFIPRINVGDQPMWDRYTCFGPGTFSFADGPNSTNMVSFGPLLPGQVAQIRTDPRKRGVVDLTSTPPTPQHLTLFQQALKDFLSFANGNNVPPLLQQIESWFGIAPPQGNLYSLLQGRFSDSAAIPPKPAGGPAVPYFVKVAIDDGNADSHIIAAGTPMRRFPY